MSDYTVAISTDFFSSFANLPKAKQGRVMDFMSKFRSNPLSPGFNYEKIHDAYDKNMRSVRIDDTYRAILMRQEESNVFLLLWVDHHDEAYAWARKKRCVVNHVTGSIQVYESSSPEELPAGDDNPMFTDVSDEQLTKLGVPEELFALVRSISDEKGFNAAQEKLPRDAYEALDLVRDGCDIYEVIETLYGESNREEGADINTVLDNPVTKMMFTIVEGEEELKAMMNAPLDKWRVFLHPSQRRLVGKTFAGPARVLGGAGTGKTVVAMHRARALAQQCRGNERVLFTTFTANLAQDIKDNLRKICTTEEMRNIEVINIDAWITRFLQQHDYAYRIEYDEDVLTGLWADSIALTGESYEGLDESFFEEEWRTIVQAQGISTAAEYMKASRSGRGVSLNRKGRIAVWKVFEEYRTQMNIKRIRDIASAMNECCQIMENQPDYHPYKSIVVDEGQDLGMGAYRLIRRLAGEEHENDIFIVGDAHQRIYKNKVVLSRCGINVRGRSGLLRINYRTTEEIRDWAMHVLENIPFDDLDGGADSSKGYRSLTHGEMPVVEVYKSPDEEQAGLVSKIKDIINSGIDPMEICIVARTNKILGDYIAALNDAGIRYYEVKRSKTDDRQMPGVRLATMHRVKGLEFTYMFLVAINRNNMPLKSALRSSDTASKEEAMNTERCLMYVALTRAKKMAYISAYGTPSEFLC